MGSVALSLFLTMAAVHLYARLGEKPLVSAVTKPFLMPLLYYGVLSSFDVGTPYLLVLVAIFYTAGDIALIFKRHKAAFIAGVISFMTGHAFYTAFFLIRSFSIPGLIAGAVVFALPFSLYVWTIHFSHADDFPGFVIYGAAIYIFGAGISASFSISVLPSSLLALLGVVLFGYSDSRIAYNKAYNGDTSDFVIMWTYIAANIALLSAAVMR